MTLVEPTDSGYEQNSCYDQDNSFDLTQGTYSSSSSSPAGPPSKIDVSFSDSNEDSLVVKVLDTTTITTVAESDVTIKGIKADGTSETITATITATTANEVFSVTAMGDTDSYIKITAEISGEEATVAFKEDYAAFGGATNPAGEPAVPKIVSTKVLSSGATLIGAAVVATQEPLLSVTA